MLFVCNIFRPVKLLIDNGHRQFCGCIASKEVAVENHKRHGMNPKGKNDNGKMLRI